MVWFSCTYAHCEAERLFLACAVCGAERAADRSRSPLRRSGFVSLSDLPGAQGAGCCASASAMRRRWISHSLAHRLGCRGVVTIRFSLWFSRHRPPETRAPVQVPNIASAILSEIEQSADLAMNP